MRKILEQLVYSLKFTSTKYVRRKTINPEIKELMEDYFHKKRILVNQKEKEDNRIEHKLKDSYEYKCYEHFAKIDFLKNKEKASDFLKYCKFDHFKDKKMWSKSKFPFFNRKYAVPSDFLWTKLEKIIFVILVFFAFKFGFLNGYKDSMLYDELKNISNVKSEDELFNILIKKNIPVLVLYYIPGDFQSHDMQFAMGRLIEIYGEENINMAKVNCKYNLELCIKKNYLVLPQWELMYPPSVEIDSNGEEKRKIPVVPCKHDRDFEGVEGFLMQQGIIPDIFNPLYTINKAMKSYEKKL